MRVAVTGASGFVGAAIVRRLIADGHEVAALSRSTTSLLPPQVERRVGDLGDHETLLGMVDGCDLVVHAAGIVRSRDRAALHRVNVEGTRAVVAAANRGSARLVHISTAGVHGRSGDCVNEASPLRPPSPYERSKADAERVVRQLGRQVAIVRPTNVLGAGHPLDPLVRFLRAIATGRLWISAEGWANYVGVNAVAAAAVQVGTQPDGPAVVLVNEPLPLPELAAIAAKSLGVTLRFHRIPSPVATVASPVFRAAGRWLPVAHRVGATVDRTRFESVHGLWLAANGIETTLGPTLRDMVDDYRRRRLL